SKVPAPTPRGSARDIQDHAELSRQLGRLLAWLPSTEACELAGELWVGVARNRQLDDLAARGVGPTVLDDAEPRDDLGEAPKRGVDVAHDEPARNRGRREAARRDRRRRPCAGRRVGLRPWRGGGRPGPQILGLARCARLLARCTRALERRASRVGRVGFRRLLRCLRLSALFVLLLDGGVERTRGGRGGALGWLRRLFGLVRLGEARRLILQLAL